MIVRYLGLGGSLLYMSSNVYNTRITKKILMVFIAIFIYITGLMVFNYDPNAGNQVDSMLKAIDMFLVDPNEPYKIHTYILSIFSHQNILHLLINGVVFYSFGKMIESIYDSKVLVFTFIMSGLVASIMYVIIFNLGILPVSSDYSSAGLIGASGGIAGLLGLFTIRQYKYERDGENNTILLFGIIPIKVHYFAILFLLISSVLVLYGGIGYLHLAHIVHIFGMLFGFVVGYYLVYIRNIKSISGDESTSIFVNRGQLYILTDEEIEIETIHLILQDTKSEYNITNFEKLESSMAYQNDKLSYKKHNFKYVKELSDEEETKIYDSDKQQIEINNNIYNINLYPR